MTIPLEGESETGLILDLDVDVVMQDVDDDTGEYIDGDTTLGLGDTTLGLGDTELLTELMENTLAALDTRGERWDGMAGGKFGSVLERVSVLFSWLLSSFPLGTSSKTREQEEGEDMVVTVVLEVLSRELV